MLATKSSKSMLSIFLLLVVFTKPTMCEEEGRMITSLKYSKRKSSPVIGKVVPVENSQVPYLVTIKDSGRRYLRRGNLWRTICGGTIIDGSNIITAAHCFEGDNFFYANNPQYLRIVAGGQYSRILHSGNTESTEEYQWRKPIKVFIHKDFYFPYNDIALVLVDVPWEFDGKVQSIPLPTSPIQNATFCTTPGFGRVGILRVTSIAVMTPTNCSDLWEMNMDPFICTESVVPDVGIGDSGGPLACSGTGDPNERDGEPVLVGVVSGKNVDRTALYTRVSNYKNWIRLHQFVASSVQITSNLWLVMAWFFLLNFWCYGV